MKHLFTLSEWLRAKWERFATLASSAMQSLKATKRQSDTTIFAESVKVSKFRETFANRGVKDVRLSLGQYRTNIQRISNLSLTPNRFFTRFAAVFAIVFVLGLGNVWGADEVYKTALFGISNNSAGNSSYTSTFTSTTDGFVVTAANFNNNNNGWNGQIKCGRKNNASVAYISTNAAIDKKVTKVAVKIETINASKVNSIKLYRSSNGSTWTEESSFTKATGLQEASIAEANQAANLYYKVEFNCASSSNGFVAISKVEYYAAEEKEDVIVKTLKSIAVSGQTTTYDQFETFSFDGICTATYSVTKNDVPQADEQEVVTPTSVSSPNMSTTGIKEVTVTFTDDNETKTTNYNITVTEHVVTPGEYAISLNNVLYGTTAGANITVSSVSATKNDITIVSGATSGTKPRTDAACIRYYQNNYLTFSVPTGYQITSIVFAEPSTDKTWNGSISVDEGTYTNSSKSWEGETNSVTFSFDAQNRIATATVTYEATCTELAQINGSINLSHF